MHIVCLLFADFIMDIKEVPQDSKYLQDTVMRDITYAVDPEGNYHAVQSLGWSPKNEALEVTLDSINDECEEIKKRVLAGEASTLEYHMKKCLMSIELLSDYTGIPKRKIRKHLRPGDFAALGNDILQKYADTMRISVEQLKNLPE